MMMIMVLTIIVLSSSELFCMKDKPFTGLFCNGNPRKRSNSCNFPEKPKYQKTSLDETCLDETYLDETKSQDDFIYFLMNMEIDDNSYNEYYKREYERIYRKTSIAEVICFNKFIETEIPDFFYRKENDPKIKPILDAYIDVLLQRPNKLRYPTIQLTTKQSTDLTLND